MNGLSVHSTLEGISRTDVKALRDSLRDCDMLPMIIRKVPAFRSWLQDILQHFDQELVVLRDQGSKDVVACCMLNHQEHFSIWGDVEITTVCVRKQHRGKGFCKLMLQELLKHLEGCEGIRSVRIYCEKHNEVACKCYESVFGKPTHVTDKTAAFAKFIRKKKRRDVHA